MGYAVEIPTRDRNEVLVKCLRAFENQNPKPDYVIIVNNNTGEKSPIIPELSFPFSIVKNRYLTPGPEQAHQTALEIFTARHTQVGVRWDDDLIPQQGCMKILYSHFKDTNFEGAVGGCYPRPGYPVWDNAENNPFPVSGHAPSHIQFFEWKHKEKIKVVTDLYSGMMYSVKRANDVGGFCTKYSQLGFRGETDFSIRLGKCLIDPRAVAIHLLSKGGVRTIKNWLALERADKQLFAKRMAGRK